MVRAFAAVVAGAMLALASLPASAGGTVTFSVSPPSPVNLNTTTALTVAGTAGFDAPGKAVVFVDDLLDDEFFLELTQPVQDLVAGFVYVDRGARSLDLTWQVADLPDVVGGAPEVVRYMWDFSLTPPGGEPVPFEAQAKWSNVIDRQGPQTELGGAGKLSGRCTGGPVITCEKISNPPVTIDPLADEITIHIPFSDLSGLVVDGTLFNPEVVFRGITAIVQAGLSTASMGDVAGMLPFTVGNHVQAGLTLPGATDAETDFGTHLPAPTGSFGGSLSLIGQQPRTIEVAARACADASCGDSVREAVILVRS